MIDLAMILCAATLRRELPLPSLVRHGRGLAVRACATDVVRVCVRCAYLYAERMFVIDYRHYRSLHVLLVSIDTKLVKK